MIFLLTLLPLAHKMEMSNKRATGKSLLLDLTGLFMSAEGANLARRNQMKLSGKRTLPRPNSGKFVLPRLGDTDGENLVRSQAGSWKTTNYKNGSYATERISQVTLQRRAMNFVRLFDSPIPRWSLAASSLTPHHLQRRKQQ
jgi:hypothetical protein